MTAVSFFAQQCTTWDHFCKVGDWVQCKKKKVWSPPGPAQRRFSSDFWFFDYVNKALVNFTKCEIRQVQGFCVASLRADMFVNQLHDHPTKYQPTNQPTEQTTLQQIYEFSRGEKAYHGWSFSEWKSTIKAANRRRKKVVNAGRKEERERKRHLTFDIWCIVHSNDNIWYSQRMYTYMT